MKRLLILSTSFFPDPHVAAVRMTQWCRFLPEFGWKPTVLCRHYGYTADDAMLAEHVHPQVELHYLNQSESPGAVGDGAKRSRARRLSGRSVAGQLLVPDGSVLFWRRVRPQVRRHVQDLNPDVVLTTSPPHSNHDIGLWLAGTAGLPWVADFRDPFSIDRRSRPKHLGWLTWPAKRRYERAIYGRASLVVHAIPIHARWARLAFPEARSRIVVVPNGFPPNLVEAIDRASGVSDGRTRWSIRSIGTIDPEPAALLVGAVERLAGAGLDVELRLVGTPPGNVADLQRRLGDRLIVTGLVRHDEALAQIAEADLLVSCLGRRRSRSLQLTSKLFEYMATDAPILSIDPTVPDRQLLRHVPGARTLAAPSLAELAEAIRTALEDGRLSTQAVRRRRRADYDRRAQARQLAGHLDTLIQSGGPTPRNEDDNEHHRAAPLNA